MKLTQQQSDILRLIMRSKDSGDGWRNCSKVMFEIAVAPMPDELVEKDVANMRARLTITGKALVEWL